MSGAEPAGRGTTIFTGRVGKDGPAVIADILKPVAAMPDRSARLVSMVSLAIQAVHDDAQSYVNPGLRAMTAGPLWSKADICSAQRHGCAPWRRTGRLA